MHRFVYQLMPQRRHVVSVELETCSSAAGRASLFRLSAHQVLCTPVGQSGGGWAPQCRRPLGSGRQDKVVKLLGPAVFEDDLFLCDPGNAALYQLAQLGDILFDVGSYGQSTRLWRWAVRLVLLIGTVCRR